MASNFSATNFSVTQKAKMSQGLRLAYNPRLLPYQKFLQMNAKKIYDSIDEIVNGEEANPALVWHKKSAKLSSAGVEEARWGLKTTESSTASEKSQLHQNLVEEQIQRQTLKENLLFQFNLQKVSKKEHEIGEFLIGNLDDNGFYQKRFDGTTIFPDELLRELKINFSKEELEKTLFIIRNLDPVGCCVENQVESFIVQAKINGDASDNFFTVMQAIQKNSNLKKEKLLEKLNLSSVEFEQIQKYLFSLNSDLGSQFKREQNYLYPDIAIYLDEKNLPIVKVEDFFYDGLGISKSFEELANSDEASDFIKEQISQASGILEVLAYRIDCLQAIGNEIAKSQQPFFEKGPKFLAAVSQRLVAKKIGIHPSKMSRLASEKFVKTQWGIFPLSYFFSVGGCEGENGEAISRSSIKENIKEILQNASEQKSLSDEKINQILQTRGIKIARRTVAKYRKELKINSSYLR